MVPAPVTLRSICWTRPRRLEVLLNEQPPVAHRLELVRLTGLVVLLTLVVVLYWSSFSSMIAMWSLSSYRHGYLIPFISLGLIWMVRRPLLSTPWVGSWWGVGGVAVCLLVWVVARLTSAQAAEHMSVVALFSTAAWAVIGSAGYRFLLFPLAFLGFALPVGNGLIPMLMNATADVAVWVVQALGEPVWRLGTLIELAGAGARFEVAEVCSGFRYLYAGLAMGALVAHLLIRGLLCQVLYVAFVGVVFVVVNGIRAAVVMLVASASDMQVLVGHDHVVFGWVLFLITIVALYWLAERISGWSRS